MLPFSFVAHRMIESRPSVWDGTVAEVGLG